jgi:hypothetical protein
VKRGYGIHDPDDEKELQTILKKHNQQIINRVREKGIKVYSDNY